MRAVEFWVGCVLRVAVYLLFYSVEYIYLFIATESLDIPFISFMGGAVAIILDWRKTQQPMEHNLPWL